MPTASKSVNIGGCLLSTPYLTLETNEFWIYHPRGGCRRKLYCARRMSLCAAILANSGFIVGGVAVVASGWGDAGFGPGMVPGVGFVCLISGVPAGSWFSAVARMT